MGRVKKTLIAHFFLDISQFIKIVHFKHERRLLFLNDGCGYFAHFGAQYAYAARLCAHIRCAHTPCHAPICKQIRRIFLGLCPVVIHISEIEIDEALRFRDALFTDIGDERSERIVRNIEIVERSE